MDTSSRHIFHTYHLHILINNLLGGHVGSAGGRGGLGRRMRVPGALDSGSPKGRRGNYMEFAYAKGLISSATEFT